MFYQLQDTDVDLDTFLGRLGDCQTVVKALNMRVCINLQVSVLPAFNNLSRDLLFAICLQASKYYNNYRIRVCSVSGIEPECFVSFALPCMFAIF